MSRDVRLRHQHAIAASKAPQRCRLRNAPLLLVDVAVAVRVEHEQRGLEARRDEQVLEVLVAAVVEEIDHFLVSAHGAHDLSLLERPAPVPVDEPEALAGRVEELLGEFAVGRGRGPRPPLLLGLELLDALREAPVDGLLPARETTSDERYETRWKGRRATRHSSASTSPLLSVSRISKAFCSRGGWSKNCRFSSPHVLRNLMTFCERREV